MRRVLSLLLAAVFLLSLTACGALSEWIKRTTSTENAALSAPIALYAPTDCFAREALDEGKRSLYDAVYAAVLRYGELTSLPAGSDEADIEPILSCVLSDHPELFWWRGGGTTHTRGGLFSAFRFDYTMEAESIQERATALDRAIEVFCAPLPAEATDYDKALFVYEGIIRNTEYDTAVESGAPDDDAHTALGVLLNGRAVCDGYAKATQLLLSYLGVACGLVVGETQGEPHAWNLVRLDGEFYYLDTTWGDPQYEQEEESPAGGVDYRYFCVTGAEIADTHIPEEVYPLPACTASACNFFVKNGLFVDTLSDETLYALLSAAAEAGDAVLSVKFASETAATEAKVFYFDEERIFDPLWRVGLQVESLRADTIGCSQNGPVLSFYLSYDDA